ncbi:hypothetical protein evm_008471 [Chilo suppressalis]|nr:hypothetical protein evm_008471 [Chilo suppressalis]
MYIIEWKTGEGCQQTKNAVPAANKSFARTLTRLNMDKLRRIIGTLIGHCPVNKHLYTIGVTDSPLCRGCMEAEETPQHAIMECRSVVDQWTVQKNLRK